MSGGSSCISVNGIGYKACFSVAACLGGVVLAAGMFCTSAVTTFADTTTAEVPTPAQTADLTPAQITMLNSNQPIPVTMNRTNSDIPT